MTKLKMQDMSQLELLGFQRMTWKSLFAVFVSKYLLNRQLLSVADKPIVMSASVKAYQQTIPVLMMTNIWT